MKRRSFFFFFFEQEKEETEIQKKKKKNLQIRPVKSHSCLQNTAKKVRAVVFLWFLWFDLIKMKIKRAAHHCFFVVLAVSDLSEPVHAWAVVGGLVPQSPARSGPAVAAGHRLTDGPSAEAAGLKQRLPALPGHHLWYVLHNGAAETIGFTEY